ncbi:MAG: T9SS type A sorting domain-containing protein [Ignavibacteria bacterium]|nr:T9SS type A sorting domain-containing protein [Ignavibacteria bacterium]
MKKKSILFILLIVSFTSMNFRGCNFEIGPWEIFWDVVSRGFISSYSVYPPPGDNPVDTLFYSLSVGSNGKIIRGTGKSNLIFQLIPSGTTQQLNCVRVSNNSFQNNVSIAGNNGVVLVSSNTGLNWVTKTPVTSANLNAVDHNYWLFAVGDNGTILYANEMFTGSLVSRNSGTTRNLRGVVISSVNNQKIIVVGDKGTILRSTDTGNNWENVSIPDTSFNFYAINQKNANQLNSGDRFIAVGSGGRIYKSTDIGATWQQKTSGTTNTLRSVYFLNLDSGTVVGDNGTIRFTTNGGETWFTDPFFNSPSSRNYRSVSCIHMQSRTFSAMSDSIFIVSDDPVYLGINNVSTEIPKAFSLSQNYPNPFNPVTNIKFSVSKNSFVKLTIFDINGREVETIVNQNMHAGTYNADWNASGFSSGVYFYKLITDDFVETKKMILIK